jgi:putative transposase
VVENVRIFPFLGIEYRMTEHFEMPERKLNRLKGYDYSLPGYYFVTFFVHNRACIFGMINDDEMYLSASGKIIHYWWHCLPDTFPDIELDTFVIMPDHIHGVIRLLPECCDGSKPPSLSKIIQWFKSMTTNKVGGEIKKKLWHRSFHDHIIRNENELNLIRQYIIDNPKNWHPQK